VSVWTCARVSVPPRENRTWVSVAFGAIQDWSTGTRSVSTGIHCPACWVRTGMVSCVTVNEPSGFAVSRLVGVVSSETVTPWSWACAISEASAEVAEDWLSATVGVVVADPSANAGAPVVASRPSTNADVATVATTVLPCGIEPPVNIPSANCASTP
jgi:hypothetical protein